MPRILILDGNSLAYRAFYALPMLTTPDGRPTNVLHGFMTMLLRLQQEQQPDYWLVAFDKTKATMRIEQYAEYKANRKETPDGLRPQFDYLKELLAVFSVPILELAGYEADDLIATVAKKAEGRGWEVLIYTGDRDALQLISPHTKVYLTKKGISEVECYDQQKLWERYQLRPSQIIDLKGLMGDTSDNIPGVPGIGEKTALKLLWEFASVEGVLAGASRISGKKLQDNLSRYADQAIMSKQLATMLTEVPLEFSLDDFSYRRPQDEEVIETLSKYGLRNITRLWQEKYAVTVQHDGPELTDWSEAQMNEEDWLAKIEDWQLKRTRVTIAYRYIGANPHDGQWQEWGIGVDGEVFSLKRGEVSPKVLRAWLALLANPKAAKIIGDSKTLTAVLANEGYYLAGVSLDISLAAYLLNPARTKFEPVELVRGYFPNQEAFTGVGQEAAALAQVSVKYEEDLLKLGLVNLLHEVEEPLSTVLAHMERQGIAIDVNLLEDFGRDLAEALQNLEQVIYFMAGENFNINSTQQLGQILFEKLNLPPVKKTKTGYSTDAETLEELRGTHPVLENILEYRQLSKLMSTYVNGLLAQVRESKIHTTFQQTVTATGRLSSTEPNLQNIPIRLEYGRRLRKVFKPTEAGWLLLSADYSQIELRILAHYSEDPLLCESFALGQDVHTRTAAEVFGVPLAEVTPDQRRKAKAVNFGLVYGLTDFGLARDLGIPRKEAKSYIEQYFARYQGVKKYMEEAVANAKKEGQVRTLLNRMRRIPELHHPNRTQRQFGERIAMNTPIQGTAADIMKLAMLRVEEGIAGLQAAMLLQVHDELLIQVAPQELDLVAAITKEKMENAFPLNVPLVVDCKVGPNWYDMSLYDK